MRNAATLEDARINLARINLEGADAESSAAERQTPLPFLGWIVATAISFPLWTVIAYASWIVFFR